MTDQDKKIKIIREAIRLNEEKADMLQTEACKFDLANNRLRRLITGITNHHELSEYDQNTWAALLVEMEIGNDSLEVMAIVNSKMP